MISSISEVGASYAKIVYMVTDKTIIESVAKALIINSDGKTLTLILGEHRKHPEKSYRPDLPGGIVDSGESEQEAVVREVSEECGLVLHSSTMQLVYSSTEYYEAENKSVTKLLYIAFIDEPPTVTLSWEHSDYKWVAIGDLKNIDLRPFFNDAIKYCIDNRLI